VTALVQRHPVDGRRIPAQRPRRWAATTSTRVCSSADRVAQAGRPAQIEVVRQRGALGDYDRRTLVA